MDGQVLPRQRTVRIVGIVAALNGLVGALSDFLLLYAPGFSANRFEAVLSIPTGRLLAGFYLGILFLPLYVFGYWIIYQFLTPAGRWRSDPVLFIGVYGSALGTVFHASAGLGVKILLEQNGPEEALSPYMPFLVPLFIIVHAVVVLGSIWFGVAIWDRRTPFPRWMVLVSPGLLTALLFAVALVGPPIGDFLQPTALNLAHVAFFVAATFVLWNHVSDRSADHG